MTLQENFVAALQSPQPDGQLDEMVRQLAKQGFSQQQIYNVFDEFRACLRAANNESEEDIIMDAMDRICGWCAPHAVLFSSYITGDSPAGTSLDGE